MSRPLANATLVEALLGKTPEDLTEIISQVPNVMDSIPPARTALERRSLATALRELGIQAQHEGKTLLICSARFHYSGTLQEANEDYIILSNAVMVFSTGSLKDADFKTSEKI